MARGHCYIKKEEFSKLLFNMLDGMSTHDLSMWLKSKTDDKFVVIPRDFAKMVILFFEAEGERHKDFLPHADEMLEDLRFIKKYL